ncbi:MAG: SRPBCC family protein [Pseudooceanicola sp.]
MVRVRHRIGIGARPDLAWRVTAQVTEWPLWHPLVRMVRPRDGAMPKVGQRFELKQPGQPPTVWRVVDFVPGARFEWEADTRFGKLRAGHEIEATARGCHSLLWIEAGVLAAPLLWLAIMVENRALRKECERRAPDAA